MKGSLQVTFNSPQSGWMSLGLKAGGQSFVTAVSYMPYDSLHDLIVALNILLDGADAATIKWNREPEEYDFVLKREGDRVQLEIVRYPNHRRRRRESETVLTHTAPLHGICTAFVVALRELRRDRAVDEFEKNWRREFPAQELQALTKRLQDITLTPHTGTKGLRA